MPSGHTHKTSSTSYRVVESEVNYTDLLSKYDEIRNRWMVLAQSQFETQDVFLDVLKDIQNKKEGWSETHLSVKSNFSKNQAELEERLRIMSMKLQEAKKDALLEREKRNDAEMIINIVRNTIGNKSGTFTDEEREAFQNNIRKYDRYANEEKEKTIRNRQNFVNRQSNPNHLEFQSSSESEGDEEAKESRTMRRTRYRNSKAERETTVWRTMMAEKDVTYTKYGGKAAHGQVQDSTRRRSASEPPNDSDATSATATSTTTNTEHSSFTATCTSTTTTTDTDDTTKSDTNNRLARNRRRSRSLIDTEQVRHAVGSYVNSHNFVSRSSITKHKCMACSKSIFPGRLIMKCRDCKSVVHPQCSSNVSNSCSGFVVGSGNNTPVKEVRLTLKNLSGSQKSPHVPDIIRQCVNNIEQRGLLEEGIYRVSGSVKSVNRLFEKYIKSGNVDFNRVEDVNVVTSFLKKLLSSLKEPLITHSLWDQFAKCISRSNEDEIFRCLDALPIPNKDTLAFLMIHLHKIASNESINKMSLKKLATCIGPSIVGNTRSAEYSVALIGKEYTKQAAIMAQLLKTDLEYWQTTLKAERKNSKSFLNSPEQFYSPNNSRPGSPATFGNSGTRKQFNAPLMR